MLTQSPYLFVSSSNPNGESITQLKAMVVDSGRVWEEFRVRADKTGYFVVFGEFAKGEQQAYRCLGYLRGRAFEGERMKIVLHDREAGGSGARGMKPKW